MLSYATVALLLADTDMGYSGSPVVSVSDGDEVWGEGFRYRVAASGASDHHVETAGGVKLYVQRNADNSHNVRAFGAFGGNLETDTAAIQKAIDTAAPVIIYPDTASPYLVADIALRSFQTHRGGSGKPRIDTNAVGLTWPSTTQYVFFEGLAFGGSGKAIYQPDASFYMLGLHVRDCQFGNTLEECIYGTALLSIIEGNMFGANFGTLAAHHRHIFLKGTTAGGLAINRNTIKNNRFYRANGSGTSAVYIEFGAGNVFEANTWEECYVTPLMLDSAGLTTLTAGNWFEGNNVASQIVMRNTELRSQFYRSKVLVDGGNQFLLLNAACHRICDMDANSQIVAFNDNMLLTTATPSISRRNNVTNAGIRRHPLGVTFVGSWVRAKSARNG